VSVGSVDGFGSIIVNGVRFETSSTSYDLEEFTALALGHVVRVDGTLSAGASGGTASVVHAAPEVQGVVSTVQRSDSTFTAMGQLISISSATVFDGVTSVADLAPGDAVRVSGLPFHAGQLLASRITKLASPPSVVYVTGQITSSDIGGKTFKVGAQTVSFTGTTSIDGGTGATLRVGAYVRVNGASGTGGVVQAARVRVWQAPAAESTAVSWSGVVSDYASLASFNIAGQPVDASSAQITGGPSSSIGNGVRVEIDGTVVGGAIKASKLRIKHVPGTGGPVSFTANGAIGAFSSSASFRVQGQPINASGSGVVFVNGTAANLRNGTKVTVSGSQVVNGVLIANTVTFE
jgi:Domain of unknown function (DUF5666)